MCHVAALPRHLVYHHFQVYDNVSRLFSIDFSKMTNFKEKNQEVKVLISALLKGLW